MSLQRQNKGSFKGLKVTWSAGKVEPVYSSNCEPLIYRYEEEFAEGLKVAHTEKKTQKPFSLSREGTVNVM